MTSVGHLLNEPLLCANRHLDAVLEWLTGIGLQDFRIAMMKIGVEEEDDVVGLVEESDLQNMGMSK